MSESRAARLRASRQWGIRLKTGGEEIEILVATPSVHDMIEAGIDPIVADVTASPEERQAVIEAQTKSWQSDLRTFFPFACKLLAVAMVDPKFHNDPDAPCPEDAVTARDLGNGVFLIASELLMAMGQEVEGGGVTAARFRMDANGQGGAPGSAAVRDEPARDPAAAEA